MIPVVRIKSHLEVLMRLLIVVAAIVLLNSSTMSQQPYAELQKALHQDTF